MHMEKITPPPSSPRVAALLRTVALFERDDIESAVDSLIALLDARDGDADLEPNGDELDASWPEAERVRFALNRDLAAFHEDAEEDDAAEDDGEDRCEAGDDHMVAGPVAQLEWWNPHVRSGRAIGDEDDAHPNDDVETFTWPEAIYQPSSMAGGIVVGLHDEDERADVAPQWPVDTANDNERRAA